MKTSTGVNLCRVESSLSFSPLALFSNYGHFNYYIPLAPRSPLKTNNESGDVVDFRPPVATPMILPFL